MKLTFLLVAGALCGLGQEGSGPYPAIYETDAGLPTHTVYRAKDLGAVKGTLPILAWGNGACANNGLAHRNFLLEIASHGFLAIAIGPPVVSPAPGPRPAGAGPATKSSQLVDAMNWAIAENGRKGSPYYKKLDTSRIAVMGMSCGGIQTYAVATDPRIRMLGIWNSGILKAPTRPGGPQMEDVRKEELEKLRTPIFFVMGDKTDIAFENGLDDFTRITKVPAIHMYRDGVGHGGTYGQPNGGEFGKVGVALLQWQLKGHKKAGKMFLGAQCGLCEAPGWHVSKKGFQ